MSILSGSFTTTEQESPMRTMTVGKRLIVSLFGTWTGAVRVVMHKDGLSEDQLALLTTNGTREYDVPAGAQVHLHAAMVSTGTVGWRLEEANSVVYLGDREWDDYQTQVATINPLGAVSDPTVDTDETSWPGTLLFSASATNLISGMWQMQHSWAQGTPIRPHIHWMQTGVDTGKALWHFYYRRVSRSSASEAWNGPVIGVDEMSTGSIADQEGITAFGQIELDTGTSRSIAWRLYRIGGNVADTLTTTARLLHIDYHYQKDSLGSGGEYIK